MSSGCRNQGVDPMSSRAISFVRRVREVAMMAACLESRPRSTNTVEEPEESSEEDSSPN